MKNNRTVLFLIIFAVCIFCFISCGRNDTTGSTPSGTGSGAGSVSGNMSNDTINSNRGNADGGMADYDTNTGIIDGAAGDMLDGARDVADNVTNGIRNGIDNMTGNNYSDGNSLNTVNSGLGTNATTSDMTANY
jgi:hypothetical protein